MNREYPAIYKNVTIPSIVMAGSGINIHPKADNFALYDMKLEIVITKTGGRSMR
ncbi:MAG: hypothetical protein QXO47_02955 [Thermoproteota archaeon]|nr:hypothetical protein [Candidatus Brockarchaeota archaeon]